MRKRWWILGAMGVATAALAVSGTVWWRSTARSTSWSNHLQSLMSPCGTGELQRVQPSSHGFGQFIEPGQIRRVLAKLDQQTLLHRARGYANRIEMLHSLEHGFHCTEATSSHRAPTQSFVAPSPGGATAPMSTAHCFAACGRRLHCGSLSSTASLPH